MCRTTFMMGVLAAALMLPAPAAAQAPAPLPPVAVTKEKLPPFREGAIYLSFIANTGNTDSQTMGLGGDIVVRPDNWEIRNRAGFVRAESDGELTAEAFFPDFRAARELSALVAKS